MNWAKQGVLFKLPLCKTVQFQCRGPTYFYRTARLWNTLPFVIRDASSLQIFKNLNELYLTMVNLFDVNKLILYIDYSIINVPGAWLVLV